MKSFEDFLSTLTEADVKDVTALAMSALKQSDETFSERELKIAVSVSQATALSCREILRRYHDWLSEQM